MIVHVRCPLKTNQVTVVLFLMLLILMLLHKQKLMQKVGKVAITKFFVMMQFSLCPLVSMELHLEL